MERRRRPARLDVDPMTKVTRRREKPRERWLLTRKTWKYMSDAGRRLIPDGAQNRPEDVPRIEAYFQDVCAREPRFLLWRKSSYPGALPKPRRKKRARGGSVRARSPSDDGPPPARPTDLYIGHTSGGRFDIAKLRRDFFATPPTPSTSGSNSALNAAPKPEDEEENTLVDLLRKYLKVEEAEGVTKSSENEELNRALRRYLKRQADKVPADADADPSQRTLLDNLSRYYCRSPNRDNIVQDILTDRSLLKRLYHDLRKTKPYRGGRSGGSGGGYRPSGFPSASSLARGGLRTQTLGVTRFMSDGEDSMRSPPMSPPPLIEVCESAEDKFVDCGTQTLPIPEEVLLEIERVYREKLEATTAPTSPTSPPPDRKPTNRRRSSVDHDDVSQSVSDTIKRYLRMARKKSVDADKADRFKRINYDKNLRNIKPRAPGEVDDDGPNKGCQTEEGWILTYRELQFASVASTPTSPPSPASPSQSHSFLSTLLGRNAPAHMAPVSTGGMQKSRSTGSVVLQSVSRKLFRTRSRSSSRATAWTPQGSCRWVDSAGRCVRLTDTSLLTLSEVERKALQQVALARLQELKLGIPIKIPEENTTVPAASKPKRRPMLLKKKAFTTNIFDQSRKDDKDKDAHAVFGVSLAQCVESEKALRRQQLLGSRASLASLSALEKGDDNESCDSGDWGWAALEDAEAGPKVPTVVTACLAHLRRYGLHTIGLFRVSASIKRVRQLREEWERMQSSPLDQTTCPHDVATLLKEFLRDLPDPLLCRDLYYAFLQTQKIRSRRTQFEAIRLIVQLLPAAHRDTLNALLSFLAQLATHSADSKDEPPGNRMTAENLATIIAPSILHRNRPNETASADQLSERLDVINVVRQLVERQTELWTLPAETLHQAYVQLLHTQPACLDALLLRRVETAPIEHPVVGSASDSAVRRTWSREEFLHGAAATGGAQESPRSSEKTYFRTRRTREASDTSSGSLSSAMTIVTSRLRSSEGSSGIASISHARDSAADSNDSASDYNETLGGSDDDSCIIKASLHIPAASMSRARPAPPPRRRSTSGSESSAKRDSAVGSSAASVVGSSAASASASPSGASASASAASSPPASPPPVPAASAVRVTLSATGGEVRRASRQAHADNIDIDRLISLGKERNTSDARAVVLRQHDESSTSARRVSTRQEQLLRREDHSLRREEQLSRRDDKEVRREEQTVKKEGTTLYKRGELISSARPST